MEIPAGARVIDLGDNILAPGFIDIHVHGSGGHDVMEGTPEALIAVARIAAQHGTTSFLPTTLTVPISMLKTSLDKISSIIGKWNGGSSGIAAEPLGIHMEGPFLNNIRRGVHPSEHLQEASASVFQELAAAAHGRVRVLTLAPELAGAAGLQDFATRSGIRVAIGHSDATFEEASRAISAGASHAVHMFNAMRPFAHRETGIIGAVLTDDRIQAEIIADGVHVSGPALRLLVRSKGASGVVLVTDGVSATGMPAGRYRLGEMEIVVKEESRADGRSSAWEGPLLVCRNSEGKLAGSVLTQDRAVTNMVALAGVTLQQAVTMATWNPARLLGVENSKGCIRPGADADLVLLHQNGSIGGVMKRGRANFFDG